MSGKNNISKDVLSAVNKKTGKPVTENAVKKLASNVTEDTIHNEEELQKTNQIGVRHGEGLRDGSDH